MSNERGTDEPIRDTGVDAAWRSVSTEEPAPTADANILAAARAATRSPSNSSTSRARRRWWTHWQPLVAAAGVAGLAFLLVQRLPTEPESRVPMQAPLTSAPATLEAPAGPVTRESAELPEARRVAPSPVATTERAAADIPTADTIPASPAPIEVPAAAVSPTARQSVPRAPVTSSQSEFAHQSRELDANAVPEASAPAARAEAAGLAAAKSAPAVADPEAWVRRIVALHGAGDLPAATAELRAFRREFPDADDRLPAALREWAATVEPAVH